jgi:hypothetical protein
LRREAHEISKLIPPCSQQETESLIGGGHKIGRLAGDHAAAGVTNARTQPPFIFILDCVVYLLNSGLMLLFSLHSIGFLLRRDAPRAMRPGKQR